jgi:dTDP-L-rhamnose 4-epimerase
MSKTVLITGGAGFLGSHMADRLLARGYHVRVFDNLTPQVHANGFPDYLSKNVEFFEGDMRDLDRVKFAVAGVDAVFHLAAAVGVGQSMYEISHYMGANSQGTANLLQALLDTRTDIEKMVVASSMSIYGEGKYECTECGDVAPGPRSTEQLKMKDFEVHCPSCDRVVTPVATDESKPLQYTSYYALGKKAQEEMCLLFGRTYNVPVTALRYWNIFGTRQALGNPYTGVAAIFASRLLNHRAPLVYEDGRQLRDFVSVHDVVEANLLAMERHEADDMALNIASGHKISINEVAAQLLDELGLADEIRPEITGKYRAGDIRHCFADISLARRVLGYKPKYRFADGVRELVDWLREQTAEDRAAEAAQHLTAFGLTA